MAIVGSTKVIVGSQEDSLKAVVERVVGDCKYTRTTKEMLGARGKSIYVDTTYMTRTAGSGSLNVGQEAIPNAAQWLCEEGICSVI